MKLPLPARPGTKVQSRESILNLSGALCCPLQKLRNRLGFSACIFSRCDLSRGLQHHGSWVEQLQCRVALVVVVVLVAIPFVVAVFVVVVVVVRDAVAKPKSKDQSLKELLNSSKLCFWWEITPTR